jgi:hypothetical protein
MLGTFYDFIHNSLMSVKVSVAGMRFELRLSEHASGSAFVVIEFGLSIMVACPWKEERGYILEERRQVLCGSRIGGWEGAW